jgi:hypothetical protein
VKVLSHRGYWLERGERNQRVAFERSFSLGFGTETDIRDRSEQLVISHDAPKGDEMTAESVFAMPGAPQLTLALNIKADGLAAALVPLCRSRGLEDWFVFDMAVPDMRSYLALGAPVFTRMSEVEREPPWLERAAGVWLDAFESTWYDTAVIQGLLRSGKRVCVVSPELHGREAEATWALLRPLAAEPGLMICTDRPEQAAAFFGVAS